MSGCANQNRTYIYRIRRKEDGKFLESAPCRIPGECTFWGPCGTFWKKEETIREHLLALCQFRLYCGTGLVSRSSHANAPYRKRHNPHNPFWVVYPYDTEHRLVRTVFEWLDKYEVIATEITVHGSQTIEARDFASFINDDRKAQ